jgi:ferric-dicitrate binding protein FerR (iron transport regulator)
MKDFSLFEIADFVMDEDFIRWVNARSKADDIFWENWLKRNPNKHLIIAEARRILESIGSEQAVVAPAVIELEIEKVLQAINLQSELPVEESPVRRLSRIWKFAAAAILVIAVLGVTALVFTHEEKRPEKFAYAAVTSSRQLIESINTSKNTITVPLPDGSTVKLASNSRISYESNFDSLQTRDVYLSGQAFFNVKKNPHRPFRVFANEIVAKVLGTSFSIRAFEKDTVIQVTVSTGKVSVYSQGQVTVKETAAPNKLGGIIVTPNQQLVYEKLRQEFQKVLLDDPMMINAVSVNKTMAYEETPIDKVFDDLGRDYGINIVYDSDVLKKCTLTGDLSKESFYQKLDFICRAIGARYEVIDAQVVIQSNGCQ